MRLSVFFPFCDINVKLFGFLTQVFIKSTSQVTVNMISHDFPIFRESIL
jgi:hypothetical protein